MKNQKEERSASPLKSSARHDGNHNNSSNNRNPQQILDFIGPSGAVKELFAMPYTSSDVGVSVAVHNMGGGTLLLDGGGDDAYIVPPSQSNASSFSSNTDETKNNKQKNQNSSQSNSSNTSRAKNDPTPIPLHNRYESSIPGGGTAAFPQHHHLGGGGASAALSLVTSMLRQLSESDRKSISHKEKKEKNQVDDIIGNKTNMEIQNLSSKSTYLKDFSLTSKIDNKLIETNRVTTSTSLIPAPSNIKNLSESNMSKKSSITEIIRSDSNSNISDFTSVATPATISFTDSPSSLLTQRNEGHEHNNNNTLALIKPPEYHSRNVVRPPVEPKQYLSWKFHDMNLLIASDAIIYRPHHHPSHPSHKNTSDANPTNAGHDFFSNSQNGTENFSQSQKGNYNHNQSNTASMSQAITLRVENEFDFKQQVLKAQELSMIQENSSIHHVNSSNPNINSYAAALKSTKPPPRTQNKTNEIEEVEMKEIEESKDTSTASDTLAQVHLQTCIMPTLQDSQFDTSSSHNNKVPSSPSPSHSDIPPTTTSPISTCLDAYLDNIISNVPQLALCLEEKGFVQSVKLLRTEDIPTHMMMMQDVTMPAPTSSTNPSNNSPEINNPSFSNTNTNTNTKPPSTSSTPNPTNTQNRQKPMFSPSVVDLNATMLLQFLKENCSSENSTYLLRRNAGEQNIQLYDVTSISSKRQRKWTWWLAMMSYRFALRLSQLSKSDYFDGSDYSDAMKRNCRARERSLLQTSLDLLMELADMDGGDHETIRASVNELLADTFLGQISSSPSDIGNFDCMEEEISQKSNYSSSGSSPFKGAYKKSSSSPALIFGSESESANDFSPNKIKTRAPTPTSSGSQPYSNVKADGLNKAQDFIMSAIRTLSPLLDKARKEQSIALEKKRDKEEEVKKSQKKQEQERRNNSSRRRYIRKKPTLIMSSETDQDENKKDDFHEDRLPTGTSLTDLIQQMKSVDLTANNNADIVPMVPTNASPDLQAMSISKKDIENDIDLESTIFQVEAVSMQLYGLHHKLINVSLRLAEHHLRNYWSSSVMQALRSAARRIADVVALLSPLGLLDSKSSLDNTTRPSSFLEQVLNQYARLWEFCGHFARSFAGDYLWRDQGHACGEDVVALLQDVEAACVVLGEEKSVPASLGSTSLEDKTKGQVTLHSLSGIISPNCSGALNNVSHSDIDKNPTCLHLANKLLSQQSQLKREKRRVLIASVICYSRAIGTFIALMEEEDSSNLIAESSSLFSRPNIISEAKVSTSDNQKGEKKSKINLSILSLLRKRLGDACNEIGKVLLSTLKEVLVTSMNSKSPAIPLLESAQFWFEEGLEHFEQCGDLRNIALLRCNLCQCCKVSANSQIILSKKKEVGEKNSTNAEEYLQEATVHLQKAHSALIQRDEDPKTWDMVSEELAATFLVLGVRRRQSLLGGGTTPIIMQALRLTPGKERSVVHPMEQALEIYEKLLNAHQAAAAHYQLALFYAKVWTCQRNETKTREKLSSAFIHYSHAHRYFFSSMRGNEPTFIILSLDLSNLYSSVSGEECLKKALACCLDTCDAFSPEAVSVSLEQQQYPGHPPADNTEWCNKMLTLAESIEDRVVKLLLNLVKVEKEGDASDDKFKEMYREALMFKMATAKKGHSNGARGGFKIHELLTKLKGRNVL